MASALHHQDTLQAILWGVAAFGVVLTAIAFAALNLLDGGR